MNLKRLSVKVTGRKCTKILDAIKKEQYTAQISLLRHKIEVADSDIIQIKERAEKVEFKAYVEGTMNIAKAEKFVAELNKKIEAKNKEIIKYNSEITSLENLLLACGHL